MVAAAVASAASSRLERARREELEGEMARPCFSESRASGKRERERSARVER